MYRNEYCYWAKLSYRPLARCNDYDWQFQHANNQRQGFISSLWSSLPIVSCPILPNQTALLEERKEKWFCLRWVFFLGEKVVLWLVVRYRRDAEYVCILFLLAVLLLPAVKENCAHWLSPRTFSSQRKKNWGNLFWMSSVKTNRTTQHLRNKLFRIWFKSGQYWNNCISKFGSWHGMKNKRESWRWSGL